MHHSTRGTVLCILGSTSENPLGPAAKRFTGFSPRTSRPSSKSSQTAKTKMKTMAAWSIQNPTKLHSKQCPKASRIVQLNPTKGSQASIHGSKLLLARPTWIRVSPLFPILQLKPFPVVHLGRLANTFQMEQPWIHISNKKLPRKEERFLERIWKLKGEFCNILSIRVSN